jgi:hypothetical protein
MAILIGATVVCKAQNETQNDDKQSMGFKMKSGHVTYQVVEGEKEGILNFIFDDYGARIRFEAEEGCSIGDATNQKAYMLNHADKTYSEVDAFAAFFVLYMFIYPGDNPIVKEYPSYQELPNRSIADRECTVFSYSQSKGTSTFGGWQGLILFSEDPKRKLTAISFSETVPENSFTVPENYKLIEK